MKAIRIIEYDPSKKNRFGGLERSITHNSNSFAVAIFYRNRTYYSVIIIVDST